MGGLGDRFGSSPTGAPTRAIVTVSIRQSPKLDAPDFGSGRPSQEGVVEEKRDHEGTLSHPARESHCWTGRPIRPF